MINFKEWKKIHFIGIGGIGMSAMARMMLSSSKTVTGSDTEETPITDGLKEEGVKILIGHEEDHITPDTDAVLYTIAVKDDNPELKKARSLNIPTFSYPEALGLISKGLFTIAVSGTHGKTTTTAMIGKILKDADYSPTIIVGSILVDGGTNFVSGTSDILIVEACEYNRSFLHLNPNILVITNIDNDHLDYYRDLQDIQSAFKELAQKVPKDGYIVTNPHNASITPVLGEVNGQVIDYTSHNMTGVHLRVPGEHNVLNAQAALAVAEVLGTNSSTSLKALNEFKGTWRRFEYKGKIKNDALIYDDYAHHPVEIKATLKAARESFPNKRLTVIFQPHLYSRTKLLLDEFAVSFSDADRVIIAPIYAAREDKIPDINSEILAEKIKAYNPNTIALNTFQEIQEHMIEHAKKDDVIFTIGAGDIYKVAEQLTT